MKSPSLARIGLRVCMHNRKSERRVALARLVLGRRRLGRRAMRLVTIKKNSGSAPLLQAEIFADGADHQAMVD